MTGITVLKRVNLVVFMGIFAMLVGCKLQVISPSGGTVTWSDGGFCPAGSVCDLEITDTEFGETFTANPAPGYEFVKWQDGSSFQCADSTDSTCIVSSAGVVIPPELIAEFEFDQSYIMPVYKDVGVDTDGDGIVDREDDDDDNDNILDVDDLCPATPEGEVVDEFGCSGPIDACTGAPADVVCGYEISASDWISPAVEETRIEIPKGKTLASKFTTSGTSTSHGRFQFQTPPGFLKATAIAWVSLSAGGEPLSEQCTRGPASNNYSFTWTQFDNRYCDLQPSQDYFLNIRHTDITTPSSTIMRDVVTSSS